MYLFHNTNLKALKSILKENKLKASYLTNNLNEGDGIYKSNKQKFIFFSVIDKYNSNYKISGNIVLYFSYEILSNRTFYVSTCHTPSPDNLSIWNNGKDYKKKYKQYYKNIIDVLTKLFNNSVSNLPNGKSFQVFQQVAIKKQVNLKYLKYIKFIKSKPTNEIIKIIKNKYPNVVIICENK